MEDINSINITGRIAGSFKTIYDNNGYKIISFNLMYHTYRGRGKDAPYYQFINVILRGKIADYALKYCSQHNKIGVSGTINIKEKSGKDGKITKYFSIDADNIYLINKRKEDCDLLSVIQKLDNSLSTSGDKKEIAKRLIEYANSILNEEDAFTEERAENECNKYEED